MAVGESLTAGEDDALTESQIDRLAMAMAPMKVVDVKKQRESDDEMDEIIFSRINDLKAVAFGCLGIDEEIIESLSSAHEGDILSLTKSTENMGQ